MSHYIDESMSMCSVSENIQKHEISLPLSSPLTIKVSLTFQVNIQSEQCCPLLWDNWLHSKSNVLSINAFMFLLFSRYYYINFSIKIELTMAHRLRH